MEWAIVLFGLFAFVILPDIFDSNNEQTSDTGGGGGGGGGGDLLDGGTDDGAGDDLWDSGSGDGTGDDMDNGGGSDTVAADGSEDGGAGSDNVNEDSDITAEEGSGAFNPDTEFDEELAMADAAKGDTTDQSDNHPVAVEGFDVDEDVLILELKPGVSEDTGNIDVIPSDDGEDGNVYMDNELIAVLMGAPEASPEDVFVKASRLAA